MQIRIRKTIDYRFVTMMMMLGREIFHTLGKNFVILRILFYLIGWLIERLISMYQIFPFPIPLQAIGFGMEWSGMRTHPAPHAALLHTS